MSKFVPDATIDKLLDEVATATLQSVVDDVATPTFVTTANTLTSSAMIAGTGTGGSYTISAGDVSGRKVAMDQKSGLSITKGGTARHVVLSLAGTILDITTCTDQVLTSGGTLTIPTWDHEILDPT